MGRVTVRRPVVVLTAGPRPASRRRPDTLVVEEPLELRVGGRSLAVTMRTPGQDFDLAAGFCVSEGLAARRADVHAMRYCAGASRADPAGGADPADGGNSYNVVDVELDPSLPPPGPSAFRSVYTTSACGVCGKASLQAVRTTSSYDVSADPVRLDPATLVELPERLRRAQRVFEVTGGLHAAGLFAPDGTLEVLREDVGRHNAVDKVVGHALRCGLLPLRGRVLLVSGRASFELVQKAVMAGVPVLAAVSAPSSLAVDLAAEAGLTLVAFLRGDRMNVYTAPQRLGVAPDERAAQPGAAPLAPVAAGPTAEPTAGPTAEPTAQPTTRVASPAATSSPTTG